VTRAAACVLLLAAACARSNESLLRDLEADGRAHPRPDLERVAGGTDPVAVAPAAPPAATLAWLRGRLPTVAGSVNGVAMPLVLDTGTSAVTLSGPAARAAGVYVPAREPVAVTSPGYDTPHRLAVFERLGLGDLHFGAGVATVAMHERRDAYEVGSTRYGIVGGAV
jgi:hypothetical protein